MDYKAIYTQDYFDSYGTEYHTGNPEHLFPSVYHKNASVARTLHLIGDMIAEQNRPKTALDVGCAAGFLVAALRLHGVQAYGIDVSEYIVEHAIPLARPYCKVVDISERAFWKHVELVTCIEVLEHLEEDDAKVALDNIINCAERTVIFSSTEAEDGERWHVNLHPPDYWIEQFWIRGFERDPEYENPYLPWALKFDAI